MRIHKEGYRIIFNCFLAISIIIIIFYLTVGASNVSYIATTAGALLFIIVVFFFRVPKRELDEEIKDNIFAPADGTVVAVKEVYEKEYLKSECIQVSIFMSVLNVHVNWFPFDGEVEYYKYHPGNYLVAMHPKSSEKNERTSIVVNNGGQKVLLRQIAGLLARRIVCYAKEGSVVKYGDQIGFIKFGSRVDLFLPLSSRVQVTKGQRVKGCKTIIAKL